MSAIDGDGERGPDGLIEPSGDIAALLIDTHCHPTDDPIAYTCEDQEALSREIERAHLWKVVCMSTNARDQDMVAYLAEANKDKVVPCFGWHPWFSHQISLRDPAPSKQEHYTEVFGGASEELVEIWDQLPDPISIAQVAQNIARAFERFPAALLGEVGIDRAFRIPRKWWSYDPRAEAAPVQEGSKLTKLKTPPAHQLEVLRRQIDVALRYGRNVSLHSVQAAGMTVELLDSLRNADPTAFGSIRVSLHSCTLDNNVVRSVSKKHANVYFGFSSTINRKQMCKADCLAGLDAQRALLESDYHTVKDMAAFLFQGVQYFAKTYGMSDVEAAKQLQSNWKRFYSTYPADVRGETDSSGSTDSDSSE
ncbi:Metallo-dependent hydrolase [Testicularia cyperi]|uniref:Metallo-dependent hydrolase n=1 Tax=Testicularia cyperi TaxID=1882483 RepID=A0A317XRJ5_9BASI|nr:Metallo-dependent hydrolase [Testicularia cyperi]